MSQALKFSPPMQRAYDRYMFALVRLNSAPSGIETTEENLLADAYDHARNALISSASQTIDDFRVKFDVMFLDEAASPSREDIHHAFQDLQHLSSQEASPIFQPEVWLEWYQRCSGGWMERDGEILLLTPTDGHADDCMAELRSSGCRKIVEALIRQKREAA